MCALIRSHVFVAFRRTCRKHVMPKEVLTVHEPGEYLPIAPQTVRAWTQVGKLPSLRVGRSISYPEDKLTRTLQRLSKASQLGA
jgi:excisionase family DNA binding protein